MVWYYVVLQGVGMADEVRCGAVLCGIVWRGVV